MLSRKEESTNLKDKIPSYILHEKFLCEQFNTPEISSLDAFREAATQATY